MRLIALGDTHGKDTWERIVKKEKKADKIVFIGDYFDSFDISYQGQRNNFLKILEYKRKYPKKVILLIGNHDFHYICEGERYSGYQYDWYREIRMMINGAIDEGLMQMCYKHDNFLFTHAGVTKTWAANSKLKIDSKYIDEEIDTLFFSKPDLFKFSPSYNREGSGDEVTQTPIWVRPLSLKRDGIEGCVQVVGHTRQDGIKLEEGFIFIDSLDSKNEYLVIDNNQPTIGSVE
jgi:predicted phosphodiesterase